MPASEETGSGPVIHDNRRIDPVTGQVRGRHVASKPAGTTGAGRPAADGEPEAGEDDLKDAEAKAAEAEAEAAEAEAVEAAEVDDEIIEGIVEDVIAAERQDAVADAEARLAERTADLQRLQAEYANYRKPPRWPACFRCWMRSARPGTTASCPAGSSRSPTRCRQRWAGSAW
jgi:molecular chaperone GrpE